MCRIKFASFSSESKLLIYSQLEQLTTDTSHDQLRLPEADEVNTSLAMKLLSWTRVNKNSKSRLGLETMKPEHFRQDILCPELNHFPSVSLYI